MTEGVIIILGASNDKEGNLNYTTRERADKAIEVFKKEKNYKLLPTGGFGAYFNTTSEPHSWHIKQYLLSKGIKDDEMLPGVMSTNTLEDAKFSKPIVDDFNIKKIIVVTSDFHFVRAWLIFKKVFNKEYTLTFKTATNTHPFGIKVRKYYHEIRQVIKILLGIIKI